MTKPDYKTVLTTQFTKDLRSIYESVWENRVDELHTIYRKGKNPR